jgi:hypothetical protein
MEEKRNDQEQKSFEILYGGTDLAVQVPNPTEDGVTFAPETVKVCKAGLRDLGKLSEAMRDEIYEIAFYVQKSPEWAEALAKYSPDDALSIIEEGRRLNARVFQRWVASRTGWVKLMGIDLEALENQKVDGSVSPKLSST